MIITYCRACHNKYRVGDFVYGECCGYPLSTREATELEEKDEKARLVALLNTTKQAELNL